MMHAEARSEFESVSLHEVWHSESSPMTTAQAEHLLMLCEGTGQVLDDSLTRGEAARLIAFLEHGKAARRSRAHAEM